MKIYVVSYDNWNAEIHERVAVFLTQEEVDVFKKENSGSYFVVEEFEIKDKVIMDKRDFIHIFGYIPTWAQTSHTEKEKEMIYRAGFKDMDDFWNHWKEQNLEQGVVEETAEQLPYYVYYTVVVGNKRIKVTVSNADPFCPTVYVYHNHVESKFLYTDDWKGILEEKYNVRVV